MLAPELAELRHLVPPVLRRSCRSCGTWVRPSCGPELAERGRASSSGV